MEKETNSLSAYKSIVNIFLQAVTLYMDSRVQQAVKYYHQNRMIVKLNWSHVQGAFGMLCLGYIMSIVVYLLEVILNIMKKIPVQEK